MSHVAMSRGLRGEDAAGTFGGRVAALRPDVVIDMVCFAAASARQLVDALRPSRPLLVHCGTIWVHGPALRVPVTEDEPRTPYGAYGTGSGTRRGSVTGCAARGAGVAGQRRAGGRRGTGGGG